MPFDAVRSKDNYPVTDTADSRTCSRVINKFAARFC